MLFGYFTLAVALLIEVIGAYYSITGLAAIFSGAVIPILIMGGVLELGKVTAAVWLKNNWERASVTFKLYLLPAVVMLMLITSMGIFGFLSKAHNDQNLVSGDVLGKIAIYDEKIKIQKDNIESARKALQQMDAAVDQTMSRSNDEKGADKATAIRRGQARERGNLQGEIARAQTEIVKLNDLRAPIAAEVRKVEAEVGPIKYIAKLIYDGDPDANILEKAVVWVIMTIVAVFDPLALVLILAAQQSIRWAQGEEPKPKQSVSEWFENAKRRARFWDQEPTHQDLEEVEPEGDEPVFDREEIPLEKLTEVEEVTQQSKDPHPPGWMFTDTLATQTNKIEPNEILKSTKDEDELSSLAKTIWAARNPDEDIVGHQAAHAAGETNRLPWHEPSYLETLPISDGEKQKLSGLMGLDADNVPPPSGTVTGFGTSFPSNAGRGDLFLRVDQLPTMLYKFNGQQWIEVDKELTDTYAHDEAYINHLIDKIDAGEYDPELLSDAEREEISKKLNT